MVSYKYAKTIYKSIVVLESLQRFIAKTYSVTNNLMVLNVADIEETSTTWVRDRNTSGRKLPVCD